MAADFGALELAGGFTDLVATYRSYADVNRITTARLYKGSARDCSQYNLLIGDPTWETNPTLSMQNHHVDDIIISARDLAAANAGALLAAGRVWTYGAISLGVPTIDNRTMWWGFFNQQLEGFLYYGINEWLNGRVDPADGIFVPYEWPQLPSKTRGESVLVYPGTNGPIGSIRLQNIRDGLEDKEYLLLYAKKTADPARARSKAAPVAWSIYPWTGPNFQTFLQGSTYDPNVLNSARAGLVPELIARVTVQQPPTYASGTPIVAQFENLPGNKLDWLAIYPAGAPGPGGYLAWRYSDGTTTGTAGIHDGSVTFNVTLPPGNYEVRLFFNNTYLRVDSAPFQVVQ